jgi:hypothetical protein
MDSPKPINLTVPISPEDREYLASISGKEDPGRMVGDWLRYQLAQRRKGEKHGQAKDRRY